MLHICLHMYTIVNYAKTQSFAYITLCITLCNFVLNFLLNSFKSQIYLHILVLLSKFCILFYSSLILICEEETNWVDNCCVVLNTESSVDACRLMQDPTSLPFQNIPKIDNLSLCAEYVFSVISLFSIMYMYEPYHNTRPCSVNNGESVLFPPFK